MSSSIDLADLKARVRLSTYVSRRVKLSPGNVDRFACCPFHQETTPSFSVNDAKGFYHCFGCSAHGDLLDWWQKVEGLSLTEAIARLKVEAGAFDQPTPPIAREEPRDRETERKQAEARAIWDASSTIGGTVAETYMRQARRIRLELPDCLRFHPGLRADHDGVEWPAMIAAVTNDAGVLVAIQRTFLKPDGSGKAPIERPKRALGPVGQGAVWLGEVRGIAGIAEGIETALSAQELFRVPTWAMLGSNLARAALPTAVRQVAIFADHGTAGEAAAAKAAARFRGERRKVAIRFPPTGNDWNDYLRALRDER